MNIKEIQSLIKFVAKSGASEVKLEMPELKITIRTGTSDSGQETTIVQQVPVAPAPAPAQPVAPAAPAQPVAPAAEKQEDTEEDDSKYITIKSPIIGTFYRKPAPDKPALSKWDQP